MNRRLPWQHARRLADGTLLVEFTRAPALLIWIAGDGQLADVAYVSVRSRSDIERILVWLEANDPLADLVDQAVMAAERRDTLDVEPDRERVELTTVDLSARGPGLEILLEVENTRPILRWFVRTRATGDRDEQEIRDEIARHDDLAAILTLAEELATGGDAT